MNVCPPSDLNSLALFCAAVASFFPCIFPAPLTLLAPASLSLLSGLHSCFPFVVTTPRSPPLICLVVERATLTATQITTDTATPKDSLFAAGFSATWHYPPGSAAAPVHAFPNAKLLLPDTIPVLLSNLSALTIDIEWTYGLGNYVHNETNNTNMAEAGVNANVAVDMFLANDRNKSASTTDSEYEVMVWFGRWGDATDPIGLFDGSQATHDVNGTIL